MRDIILNKLDEIEKAEGVRILHAVESGSRAWASPWATSWLGSAMRAVRMSMMGHLLVFFYGYNVTQGF